MTTCPRLNGRRGDRLGQVLRLFGSAYLKQYAAKLSRVQHKALRALVNCRTPAMGGHLQRCDRCGYEHHFYHSCRNRHCPQCQGPAQHRWLRARLEELLPLRCFHLVFTLPAELEPVARAHRRAVYGLLLRAAADTVLTFARNNRKMLPGILAVLHTWGQTLMHHPHAHLMVTAGGLSLDAKRWIVLKPTYLFPVRALSGVFRAKMLQGLHRQGLIPMPLYHQLHRKNWVVFCRGSRAAPHKLLLYLGRYTYRVALENRRIIDIDPQQQRVTFTYRDYRQEARVRSMSLGAFTFIGRFLQHILPKGFMKIRYYGLYAHSRKGELLPRCRRLLHDLGSGCTRTLGCLQTLLESIVHSPNTRCPRCRQGSMITVGLIAPLAPAPFHPP